MLMSSCKKLPCNESVVCRCDYCFWMRVLCVCVVEILKPRANAGNYLKTKPHEIYLKTKPGNVS